MNPPEALFDALLAAARGFSHACLLHSNDAPGRHRDWLAALGARRVYTGDPAGLEAFAAAGSGWLFGILSYDLKNVLCEPEQAVGQLSSGLPDSLGFPELCWFEPEGLAVCERGEVSFLLGGEAWFREKGLAVALAGVAGASDAADAVAADAVADAVPPPTPSCDFTYTEYADAVERLRNHIREGDVYEVNLCPRFQADGLALEPTEAFHALNKRSKAPFAGYFRADQRHLICASPERFLQRRGNRLRSQPIKGTAPRGSSPDADAELAARLLASEKDRAENTMIVDLVRNDLARVCEAGSVQVPELCGLHSFPTLHHLISTVEGQLRSGQGLHEVLRATFPMGSMTGAPKIMALDLIERCEHSRRGWYSGSLGYLEPGGDFDLNVVIRSVAYEAATGTAVWGAGGAITWDSVAEDEWQELHVKADAVAQVVRALGKPQEKPL